MKRSRIRHRRFRYRGPVRISAGRFLLSRLAAALVSATVLLAGCTGVQPPQDTETAADGETAAPVPSPSVSPGSAAPGSIPGWKRYSDASGLVAFELPQDWIVQSVPPAEGTAAGAVAVQVKDAGGVVQAELRTGIQPAGGACSPAAALPYTVLLSVPLEIPAVGDQPQVHVEPRFVFRVLQGYRFFGSYGITNLVGGPDNRACRLENVVQGPDPVMGYMFGDVSAVTAPGPAEPVGQLKAFDTITQAQEYLQTPRFQEIQRMIQSLQVRP